MWECKKESSPISHVGGVPQLMDVNSLDSHELLPATVAVEVMFPDDHAPRATPAIFQKTK